jgi:hypothetical protein
MANQNVFFDIAVDNNPIGRITFKVNSKRFPWNEILYFSPT